MQVVIPRRSAGGEEIKKYFENRKTESVLLSNALTNEGLSADVSERMIARVIRSYSAPLSAENPTNYRAHMRWEKTKRSVEILKTLKNPSPADPPPAEDEQG
jgi:hypothetical protein